MKIYLLLAVILSSSTVAIAQNQPAGSQSGSSTEPGTSAPSENTGSKMAPDKDKESSSDSKGRNFYQVLEDVLGDFEFDLKNGNVQ